MLIDALAASELEPGLEARVFLKFGLIQRPTRRCSRSYLSPNVSIAESLEHATKVGGASVWCFFRFLMQRSGNRQLRDNGCKPLLFDQCHHVVIHSMEHLWIIPADEPIPWAFTDSAAIVWGDGPSTRSIRSTCSSRKTVCPCAPRPSRISL